jgi:hypothetical protein
MSALRGRLRYGQTAIELAKVYISKAYIRTNR